MTPHPLPHPSPPHLHPSRLRDWESFNCRNQIVIGRRGVKRKEWSYVNLVRDDSVVSNPVCLGLCCPRFSSCLFWTWMSCLVLSRLFFLTSLDLDILTWTSCLVLSCPVFSSCLLWTWMSWLLLCCPVFSSCLLVTLTPCLVLLCLFKLSSLGLDVLTCVQLFFLFNLSSLDVDVLCCAVTSFHLVFS